MAIFLVEQLAAPAALAELGADIRRLQVAAAVSTTRSPVRWLQAAFVPDRAVCLSIVEAADAQSVGELLGEAGVRATVHLAVAFANHCDSPSR